MLFKHGDASAAKANEHSIVHVCEIDHRAHVLAHAVINDKVDSMLVRLVDAEASGGARQTGSRVGWASGAGNRRHRRAEERPVEMRHNLA